jgi:hypothetical protein
MATATAAPDGWKTGPLSGWKTGGGGGGAEGTCAELACAFTR